MGFGVAYVFVFVSHFPHFKISLACHSRGWLWFMTHVAKNL